MDRTLLDRVAATLEAFQVEFESPSDVNKIHKYYSRVLSFLFRCPAGPVRDLVLLVRQLFTASPPRPEPLPILFSALFYRHARIWLTQRRPLSPWR
jgi:hypothetical protein